MNVNLKALIGKLDDTARSALEGAAGLCLARTHYDIEIEHVLMKLLDAGESDAAPILRQFGIDKSRLQKELERSLDKLKSGNARTPAISPSVLKMLTEAWTLGSLDFGADQILHPVQLLGAGAQIIVPPLPLSHNTLAMSGVPSGLSLALTVR